MRTFKRIILFFLKKLEICIYHVSKLFPIKRIVVASSFYGKIYGDNPRYVIEAIHQINQKEKLFWLIDGKCEYQLPSYVKGVTSRFKRAFLLATSMVIINSHFVPVYFKRRKKQLYIFMYHGGIGIKKNSNCVPGRKKDDLPINNGNNASCMISNSLFMNGVIRDSLCFSGPIWMTGYPKDDIFFSDNTLYAEKVRDFFNLDLKSKIVIYAPTYRLDKDDTKPFEMDFLSLKESLEKRFGGEWFVFLHLHPNQQKLAGNLAKKFHPYVINANVFESMQELIASCDCLITDYSSCIFEAIERRIPCFSYAVDYDVCKETQGFYFDIDKLPFPYCKNSTELKEKIINFNYDLYIKKWDSFKRQHGLIESSNSSQLVAKAILDYMYLNIPFGGNDLIYE